MLQQTQVDRVLPLYAAFIEQFPNIEALAESPLAEVLRAWRGLGYNSRAVRLHRLARTVVEEYAGVFPRDRAALSALPGIGPYTASAIRVFAFEEDDVALDTNVRRVVHRVLFGFEVPRIAPDARLDAAAREALAPGTAHDFNSALMDLGAALCMARAARCLVCPLQSSCAASPIDPATLAAAAAHRAAKKSPRERVAFELSDRFVRGRIVDRLRELPPAESISLLDLRRAIEQIVPAERHEAIETVVRRLEIDGVIESTPSGVRLPS
jgi:A/G-specific adenine glycosylase